MIRIVLGSAGCGSSGSRQLEARARAEGPGRRLSHHAQTQAPASRQQGLGQHRPFTRAGDQPQAAALLVFGGALHQDGSAKPMDGA